jgi:hypothetical protein
MDPDYGALQEFKVDTDMAADVYWYILDLLQQEGDGFLHNKVWIMDALVRGNVYGLKVTETDAMFERRAWKDPIFNLLDRPKGMYRPMYMLPCFCIMEKDACTIMWVHSSARGKGIGRAMVQLLDIQRAQHVLEQSVGFWMACGISEFTLSPHYSF